MNFDDAVEIIFKIEGGYVHNPNDPGGETNYGISQRAYPKLNLRALTRSQAKEIYFRDYWGKVDLDGFPPRVRLMVFDSSINQGVGYSISSLQAILRITKSGPSIPLIQDALARANVEETLLEFAYRRLERYRAGANWNQFGKGWTKRVLEITLLSGG